MAGITTMVEANRYLAEKYLPNFNSEFMRSAMEEGSAFVLSPWIGLSDILCEQHQRTVGKDNCVSFEGLTLQLPVTRHRMHYVKVKIRVYRYPDGGLAIFHGPRRLADYDGQGHLVQREMRDAA